MIKLMDRMPELCIELIHGVSGNIWLASRNRACITILSSCTSLDKFYSKYTVHPMDALADNSYQELHLSSPLYLKSNEMLLYVLAGHSRPYSYASLPYICG